MEMLVEFARLARIYPNEPAVNLWEQAQANTEAAKISEAGTEFFADDAAELAELTGADYAELLGPDWLEGVPF